MELQWKRVGTGAKSEMVAGTFKQGKLITVSDSQLIELFAEIILRIMSAGTLVNSAEVVVLECKFRPDSGSLVFKLKDHPDLPAYRIGTLGLLSVWGQAAQFEKHNDPTPFRAELNKYMAKYFRIVETALERALKQVIKPRRVQLIMTSHAGLNDMTRLFE